MTKLELMLLANELDVQRKEFNISMLLGIIFVLFLLIIAFLY